MNSYGQYSVENFAHDIEFVNYYPPHVVHTYSQLPLNSGHLSKADIWSCPCRTSVIYLISLLVQCGHLLDGQSELVPSVSAIEGVDFS